MKFPPKTLNSSQDTAPGLTPSIGLVAFTTLKLDFSLAKYVVTFREKLR